MIFNENYFGQDSYLIIFFSCDLDFENEKKIRLDIYFEILGWERARAGKIKSFTP